MGPTVTILVLKTSRKHEKQEVVLKVMKMRRNPQEVNFDEALPRLAVSWSEYLLEAMHLFLIASCYY